MSDASLMPCLARLAQLQQESVDRLAVQQAVQAAVQQHPADARAQLKAVAAQLQLAPAAWRKTPDAARMPALVQGTDDALVGEAWGVLRGQNAQGQWISEWWDDSQRRWQERADAAPPGQAFASFKLSRPYVASRSPVWALIRDEILANRRLLLEAAVGGLMINVVALATSFYSMQVYDRVIPSSAAQTLLVLTLG
ncbi:MAG: ABC transporter, partial [Betaproteobacteria bacterium]